MIKIKNYFPLYLFIILTISCSQEKRDISKVNNYSNPFLSDSITYNFINEVLSQEFERYEFSCDIVLNKAQIPLFFRPEDSLQIIRMNSLFNKEDISFIFQQKAWSQNFELNPKLIKGKKVIPLDSIQAGAKKLGLLYLKEFREKYAKGGYCFITMPLFNKDKSIAIVKKEMICGNFCGERHLSVYKRINKRWVKIYELGPPLEER